MVFLKADRNISRILPWLAILSGLIKMSIKDTDLILEAVFRLNSERLKIPSSVLHLSQRLTSFDLSYTVVTRTHAEVAYTLAKAIHR